MNENTTWTQIINSLRKYYPEGSFFSLYKCETDGQKLFARIEKKTDGNMIVNLGDLLLWHTNGQTHMTLIKGSFVSENILILQPHQVPKALSDWLNSNKFRNLETMEFDQTAGQENLMSTKEELDEPETENPKADMLSKMFFGKVKKAMLDSGTFLGIGIQDGTTLVLPAPTGTLHMTTKYDGEAEKGKKNLVCLSLKDSSRSDTYVEVAISQGSNFADELITLVVAFLDLSDNGPLWRIAKLQPFTKTIENCHSASYNNGKLVLQMDHHGTACLVFVYMTGANGDKVCIEVSNGQYRESHTKYTTKFNLTQLSWRIAETFSKAINADRLDYRYRLEDCSHDLTHLRVNSL